MRARFAFLLLFLAVPLFAKDVRLYIGKPEAGSGIPDALAEDFQKKLQVKFLEREGFQVVGDEDIRQLYREAETYQQITKDCRAEECLLAIADMVNAEQVVHTRLDRRGKEVSVFAKLSRKRDDGTLGAVSAAEVTAPERHLPWYAGEIVKKLLDRSYEMRKPPFALGVDVKIEFADEAALRVGRLKKLPGVKIESDDRGVVETGKTLEARIGEGDTSFNAGRYDEALSSYQAVVRKVEELSESAVFRGKLDRVSSLARSRIVEVHSTKAKSIAKEGDTLCGQDRLEAGRDRYLQAIRYLDGLPSGVRKRTADLRGTLWGRVVKAEEARLSGRMAIGDEMYGSYQFVQAKKEYEATAAAGKRSVASRESSIRSLVRQARKKAEQAETTAFRVFWNKLTLFSSRVGVLFAKDAFEDARGLAAEAGELILASEFRLREDVQKEFSHICRFARTPYRNLEEYGAQRRKLIRRATDETSRRNGATVTVGLRNIGAAIPLNMPGLGPGYCGGVTASAYPIPLLGMRALGLEFYGGFSYHQRAAAPSWTSALPGLDGFFHMNVPIAAGVGVGRPSRRVHATARLLAGALLEMQRYDCGAEVDFGNAFLGIVGLGGRIKSRSGFGIAADVDYHLVLERMPDSSTTATGLPSVFVGHFVTVGLGIAYDVR